MNNSLKVTALLLSLFVIAFLLAPPHVAAQQAQPAQKTGSSIDTGTYSPSTSRLSSASTLGPIGSYGGAFTITNQQNAAGLLNGANAKSNISPERSLTKSAWGGGASSFSGQAAGTWTAGAGAFGGDEGSKWTAGARSFGMPLQAGGVWRVAPSSGFSSISSAGNSNASALAAGALRTTSSPGSGSLPGVSSFARIGPAANSRQPGSSLRGAGNTLSPSLPAGIRGPFAGLQQPVGSHGSSSSRTGGLSGSGSGTGTSQGSPSSQQSGSGAFSNPLSNSNPDLNVQPDGGLGSGSNGPRSNEPQY